MKKLFTLFLFVVGCIQTDIEDPFPPTLRIDNSISEIDFRVDGAYELTAVYTDDTGEPADVAIEWTSSDNSILSFNGNQALAHREGLILITATAIGVSEVLAVDVLPSREAISISGFIPVKQVGTTTTLVANYIDPDGVTSDVNANWLSSNSDVATINEDGMVTAVAVGTSEVTASFGNVSSTMELQVIAGTVEVDPEIRITSFAMFLNEGDQFQFEADYLNETGSIDETASITWSSSNESVVSIDENGLARAEAIGVSSIAASFEGVTASVVVTVEGEVTERTGTLAGVGGYDIEGDFMLTKNENDELILTIQNYVPDGPGPYFYLTNQAGNVNGGLNLGVARTGGNLTINISEIDDSVEIGTYNFLMVWCEPFRVRLGVGEFEN